MLTGALRSQVERIRDAFWSGGIRNPMEERNTKGDLDEYMLGRIASAGETVVCPTIVEAAALRADLAAFLLAQLSAMNLDDFVVRPKRRLAEKYRAPEAWTPRSPDARTEPGQEIAGLPNEQEPEDEEAKRFDLLLLRLQLAFLRHEPSLQRLSDLLKAIAGLLEEKAAIPMVRERMPLVEAIQTDEWWQDVTPAMLETALRHLRALVTPIEKQRRAPIYTGFTDQMGSEALVGLPRFGTPDGVERFREKARIFLREHEDHITIHKLRTNRPRTRSDLAGLERMLEASGVGDVAAEAQAKRESHGLGLQVRSLVGLDRGAAKSAFAGSLSGKTLNASQVEFVDLVVNHLTGHGVTSAALLYESPFTGLAPCGPDGLFPSSQVDELVTIPDRVRAAAVAA